MNTVEYQILFEVRVLHDYYLWDANQGSFFGLSPALQSDKLTQLVRKGQYDIRKDLGFIFDQAAKDTMRNQRLKLVNTPTGFYVGVEVKSATVINGVQRYRPFVGFSANTVLNFGVLVNNPALGSITNIRLRRPNGSLYFFTNNGPQLGRTLSKPITGILGGTPYQMGDLTLMGNNIREANRDNTGQANAWTLISGTGMVNQGDMSLTPDTPLVKSWLKGFTMPPSNLLGLLQIIINPDNPDKGCLDANNIIKNTHPIFELRLLARRSYWKYLKMDGFSILERNAINTGLGTTLTDLNGSFMTKEPQVLANSILALGSTYKVPVPQPGTLRAEGDRLVSDIYFSKHTPVPQ